VDWSILLLFIFLKQLIKYYLENSHSLESLHTILSTGAPLMPATYDYVYNKIKKDLLLGSISGEWL
jgi:acyl-coenzyme A synthetase/AMP-(fatty) acid ligase